MPTKRQASLKQARATARGPDSALLSLQCRIAEAYCDGDLELVRQLKTCAPTRRPPTNRGSLGRVRGGHKPSKFIAKAQPSIDASLLLPYAMQLAQEPIERPASPSAASLVIKKDPYSHAKDAAMQWQLAKWQAECAAADAAQSCNGSIYDDARVSSGTDVCVAVAELDLQVREYDAYLASIGIAPDDPVPAPTQLRICTAVDSTRKQDEAQHKSGEPTSPMIQAFNRAFSAARAFVIDTNEKNADNEAIKSLVEHVREVINEEPAPAQARTWSQWTCSFFVR